MQGLSKINKIFKEDKDFYNQHYAHGWLWKEKIDKKEKK